MKLLISSCCSQVLEHFGREDDMEGGEDGHGGHRGGQLVLKKLNDRMEHIKNKSAARDRDQQQQEHENPEQELEGGHPA